MQVHICYSQRYSSDFVSMLVHAAVCGINFIIPAQCWTQSAGVNPTVSYPMPVGI